MVNNIALCYNSSIVLPSALKDSLTTMLEDHSIDWLVPNKVVRLTLVGALSVEQFAIIGQRISEMVMGSGTPPVHLLIDQHRLDAFPKSLSALQEARALRATPNTGYVVLVGGSRLGLFLDNMIAQLLRVEMRATQSIPQAMELLHSLDAQLRPAI